MNHPSAAVVPPFPAFPAVSRYVPFGAIGESIKRICRAVEAREAISLVIGPPGVGKSLLCDLVVAQHAETHDVVILNQAPINDKTSLVRHLLHRLGADVRATAGEDLQLALVDFVCGKLAKPGGLLIVVDEAQSLSTEVLEALRMVTNITDNGQRRITAVLAGGPKMDDRLADPSMEALVQRIATRCYLDAMNTGETKMYIHEVVRQCGSNPQSTINDAAINAIHHASSGVPRLVNQLMTEAIDCAAEHDLGLIDEDLVNMAWAKLQQLPSPMVDEAKLPPINASLAVEFGALDSRTDELKPVDEPEQELELDRVPDAADLFGDFDDEQTIDVGFRTLPATQTVSHRPSQTPEQPVVDLEAALHQEILSMTPSFDGHEPTDLAAANFSEMDSHPDAEMIRDMDLAASEGMDGVELRVNDDYASVHEEPQSDNHADDDDDRVDGNHADCQLVAEEDERRAGQDDSDLLIVEDSIEMISEREQVGGSTLTGTPQSVDFQEMMTRMRTL